LSIDKSDHEIEGAGVKVQAPGRIAIVGTGLIGGSIAASFRRVFPSTFIRGYSQGKDASVALQLGLLDEECESIQECVERAEIVFLCCPVGAMPAVFAEIAKSAASFQIVTDCGSTKRSIIETARGALGSAFEKFLPGHPIAGSERHGPAGASAHLFVKRNWLLCPQSSAQEQLAGRLQPILEAMGSQVKWVDAQAHDELFAEISHFPHWMVFAACLGIANGPHGTAAMTQSGAGLKDTTRIGASSASLWADIFIDNRVPLAASLDRFDQALKEMRALLESGDKAQLSALIERASAWRKLVT
jgi:prephenate dehydrogenase